MTATATTTPITTPKPENDTAHSKPENESSSLNFQVLQTTKHRSKTKLSKRISVYANLSYVPGVKIRLFSPPRQRQKWGSDQVLPHVNWGNLFFDLFYVAAFYNLGNILVGDPSPIGIFYFLSCFFSILLLWNQKLRYDSQFTYGDDIFHKVFEAAFLVILAANVSFIHQVPRLSKPDKYPDVFGFSLSLTVLTLMNCARYIECYWYGRGQRKNIKRVTMTYLQFQIVPLAFYIASTTVAGMAYFGNSQDDDHRRSLAEAYDDDEQVTNCYNDMKKHIPMLMVLVAYVAHQLWMIVKIVWLFPTKGRHKKT